MRTTGCLIAVLGAMFVLGVPLGILLLLDPAAAQSQCAASPTGSGPSSVPGIPPNLLPIFEGAAQQYQLGSDGWAYLAALNDAESTFGTSTLPGVASGANSAGAAGPMQIGIGGAATDNWDTVKAAIPANLPGGAQPPSVYNETDAVYAGAALLQRWGAPGNWMAALVAWNNYPPEISQVEGLVARWTQSATGTAAAGGTTTTTTTGAATTGASTTTTPTTTTPAAPTTGGCTPVSGPTVPGAVAQIQPNGTAAIPQGAPPQVQAAIAAGNRIIDTFYSQERRANMLTQVQDSYDCSGSTDFILNGAGLSSSLVDVGGGVAGDSSLLMNYGQGGKGSWITVYANPGHVFIEVAGIVMDTAHYAPVQPASVPDSFPPGDPLNGGPTSGPRWQPASIIGPQIQGDTTGYFVMRHPAGL